MKKKSLQKGITVVAATTIAAAMLAGCGSSGSSNSAATDSNVADASAVSTQSADASSSEASTAGTTATADEIGEPNGGDTVTLWHYFEGEANALNAMIKQYNESQSDIYIVPTYVSREELMKQYTIGAVSGLTTKILFSLSTEYP